jgi:hypothetical protein
MKVAAIICMGIISLAILFNYHDEEDNVSLTTRYLVKMFIYLIPIIPLVYLMME